MHELIFGHVKLYLATGFYDRFCIDQDTQKDIDDHINYCIYRLSPSVKREDNNFIEIDQQDILHSLKYNKYKTSKI